MGQVFEPGRVRVLPGKAEVQVACGVTGLRRQAAGAADLLALARGHRGVENELQRVRDETPGEGRSRVRKGAAAQALAALRSAAVYLPGQVDPRNKAAATRHLAAHPRNALALLRR